MKYKVKHEAEIEGLGDIGYIEAPFDEALDILENKGYEALISGRDLAFARMKEGAKSSLSNLGSYIKEGILYTPKQNPLLLPTSSIIYNAQEATQAHRNRKEFYSSQDIVAEALNEAEEDRKKNPQERRILILPKRETYTVPTKSFGDDEATLWLFKDQARVYGEFLYENKIHEMPIWLVDKKYADNKEPFERQLLLHHLGRSGLGGDYLVLNYGLGVRGVRSGVSSKEYLEYIQSLIDPNLEQRMLN